MNEVRGVLVIDKPAGLTSHDVVARLRRITGIRRIGHGGTLDPLATGVLPMLIGRATRLAEYVAFWSKTYHFTMRLGITTDTYDADGRVVEERDASHVQQADIEAVLPSFRGSILQRPPIYSAIKREGRPLYSYARADQAVEIEPRPVDVHRIELVDYRPPDVDIVVECGTGTYARSIANDIGELLGCGAHLTALVRTAVGPFTLENAVKLEEVESAAANANWTDLLLPPDSLVGNLPQVILNDADLQSVAHGRPLRLPSIRFEPHAGDLCRAHDRMGRFVAVLRFQGSPPLWRPHKVFLGDKAPTRR